MVRMIEDLVAGKWANIEATVLQIWENSHPSIRQVGVLKDSSGIVKFVSWEKSNLPLLEEGVAYRFEGVPVTEFEDRLSVALVSTTEITRVVSKPDIPTV